MICLPSGQITPHRFTSRLEVMWDQAASNLLVHNLQLPYKFDHWDFQAGNLGRYLATTSGAKYHRQDRRDRRDRRDARDRRDRQNCHSNLTSNVIFAIVLMFYLCHCRLIFDGKVGSLHYSDDLINCQKGHKSLRLILSALKTKSKVAHVIFNELS